MFWSLNTFSPKNFFDFGDGRSPPTYGSDFYFNIKLSPERLKQLENAYQRRLMAQLPIYYPGISGCRSVVEYECLNKISEGTYGVVYRAQEKKTGFNFFFCLILLYFYKIIC